MNENVYQHFKDSERSTIDTLSNLIEQSDREYRPVVSHFLNPRELLIARSLITSSMDVKMKSFGGYTNAERQRALFYPTYYEPSMDDFELTLFEINYPVKFSTLQHGKILGTLVNSGIDREVIGDIISFGDQWQFVTQKNMTTFFSNQIDKVGKIKVKLVSKPLDEIVSPEDDWESLAITVASLRIDNLISGVYNLSRKHVKDLILAGKVQINWNEIIRPDILVGTADIVSVRGYGRIRLNEVLGKTKKEKIRLDVSIIKKK